MSAKRIHGHAGTPRKKPSRTYQSWVAMNSRCTNSNRPEYPRYGGRGITVCIKWASSFAEFLADMGIKPNGTSLDRINNNGNYEPGNCAWRTRAEQNRNARSVKLDMDKAAEIRRLHSEGRLSQKQIGAMFGVGQPLVSNIVSGMAWA